MADNIRRQVFDLGFAMGRIEEAQDGSPMLTIMTPSADTEPAQSIVVSGWENLSALAMILLEFTAGYRDSLDPDPPGGNPPPDDVFGD